MGKSAARALAEALAFELAPAGVSVTLVSPGFVDTEIHEVDRRGVRHPEARHPAPAWVRISADRAAPQIVRAVARRRREAAPARGGDGTAPARRPPPWRYRWRGRLSGGWATPRPR